MIDDLKAHLDRLLPLNGGGVPKVAFAQDRGTPPVDAYQVGFSRLEIVLDGIYRNVVSDGADGVSVIELHAGDCLYIPTNAWNQPAWTGHVWVLSVLFGKRQLGFSLVDHRGDDPGGLAASKYHRPLGGDSAIHAMLQALDAVALDRPIDPLVALAQVGAILTLTRRELDRECKVMRKPAEEDYHNICIYVQENYRSPVTRDMIAERFGFSTAHVSRIFRKYGYMQFHDYVAYVRLNRAKFALVRFELPLDEIAFRSGFNDTNYFCRFFKKKTGMTPTEYRRQKRSTA